MVERHLPDLLGHGVGVEVGVVLVVESCPSQHHGQLTAVVGVVVPCRVVSIPGMESKGVETLSTFRPQKFVSK